MLILFASVLFPSNLCPSVLDCEGSSLLSGGRECVLVEWRDGAEKNKEFLPRLGSTIEHISVSPAGDLFCTSHSDNSKSESLGARRQCIRQQPLDGKQGPKNRKRLTNTCFFPPPLLASHVTRSIIFKIVFMKI